MIVCYLAALDEDSQQPSNTGAIPKRSQVAEEHQSTSMVALPNSRLPTSRHHLPALLAGDRILQIPPLFLKLYNPWKLYLLIVWKGGKEGCIIFIKSIIAIVRIWFDFVSLNVVCSLL